MGTKRKTTADVYVGRNLVNGKVYVGSTVKGGAGRIATHKHNLKRKQHVNKYLQNSWNKHGSENFEWLVVESCPVEDQFKREQWWIDRLRASNVRHGYNILHSVRSTCPAPRRSKISKKIWESPERRASVSKKSSEKWLDPEYKARMTQVSLTQWEDPDRKARHKKRLDKRWSDPDQNAALVERNRVFWENSETRQNHGNLISDLWKTPEYRAKQQKVMADRWADPEYRKKISDQRKKMWQDPAYRAKLAARRLAKSHKEIV